jgi:hypothetical protein
MPRQQTAVERIKFALEYGTRKPFALLVPHFPDEGQDNGFFKSRDDEEVAVSVLDLAELLSLLGEAPAAPINQVNA